MNDTVFVSQTLNKVHLKVDEGKAINKIVHSILCEDDKSKCILDFDGIASATPAFFQEIVFPLLMEHGSKVISDRVVFRNVTDKLSNVFLNSCRDVEAFLDRHAADQGYNNEMHDINLTLLLKAREIARANSRLAKLIFGIQNDEIIALLVKIPVEDIRNLAKSGWICFGLRFSEAFLKEAAGSGATELDSLLNMAGEHL